MYLLGKGFIEFPRVAASPGPDTTGQEIPNAFNRAQTFGIDAFRLDFAAEALDFWREQRVVDLQHAPRIGPRRVVVLANRSDKGSLPARGPYSAR